MKLLHVSDLHIGKRLHGYSLLEDQRHVLEQIIVLASEADAVLIAGDVYDKSTPAAEAVRVVDWFFTRLAELGRPVLTISGNHDAPERIACYSEILRHSNVYMSPVFDGVMQKVELRDEWGPLDVFLLPYVRPSSVRACFPGTEVKTHEDAVRIALANTPVDSTRRNVLVAHQFVTGAAADGSEELVVGTLENMPSSLFDAFDYVALGHIHRPQRAGRDAVRYSGAPLAYAFPEPGAQPETCAAKCSAQMVELREKGSVTAETRPLSPLREMRVLRGTMRELMAMPYSEDYVKIVLADEVMPNDPVGTLGTVFPNIMSFGVSNSAETSGEEVPLLWDAESKSPLELFTEFYAARSGGQSPGGACLGIVRDIFAGLTEGGAP